MASYLDQGLPESVRDALVGLQHDAPSMSTELVAGEVEAEHGAPPAEVVAEWEPIPIAAASIGHFDEFVLEDRVTNIDADGRGRSSRAGRSGRVGPEREQIPRNT